MGKLLQQMYLPHHEKSPEYCFLYLRDEKKNPIIITIFELRTILDGDDRKSSPMKSRFFFFNCPIITVLHAGCIKFEK